MQLRQFFFAAAALAQSVFISAQAIPPPAPWALVQYASFQGSAALISNPLLTANALNIVKTVPGYVRGYHGRQHEDPNIFSIAIEWTSLGAQRNFERSHKGRQVANILKTATADGKVPTSIHLPFVSDYTVAFESPATEVVQLTILDSATTPNDMINAIANVYAGALNAAPGIILPPSRAEILEEPRSYFLTGGWEHVQDHLDAVAVEPALSLVAAAIAVIKPGYSITHTYFTKVV